MSLDSCLETFFVGDDGVAQWDADYPADGGLMENRPPTIYKLTRACDLKKGDVVSITSHDGDADTITEVVQEGHHYRVVSASWTRRLHCNRAVKHYPSASALPVA